MQSPINSEVEPGHACAMAIFAAENWDDGRDEGRLMGPFAASAWYYALNYVGPDADMDPMHPNAIY